MQTAAQTQGIGRAVKVWNAIKNFFKGIGIGWGAKEAAEELNDALDDADDQAQEGSTNKDNCSGGNELPGQGKGWRKLKGDQGWKDKKGNTWKKDKLHKDHWDVSNRKGKKVKEVDFEGRELWPNGPKNKGKR